ncbi:MAG: hypothetical protein AAGJ46_21085 [Planctomycetota bacterium]
MRRFFLVRSAKFPVLDDESEELVNEGTYGKALALYLQSALRDRGYDTPFVCCEDWGWWVELKLPQKAIGVCCYRLSPEAGISDFVCSPSPESPRMWSWRRFRFVDLSDQIAALRQDLTSILESDPDVEFVGEYDEFPL